MWGIRSNVEEERFALVPSKNPVSGDVADEVRLVSIRRGGEQFALIREMWSIVGQVSHTQPVVPANGNMRRTPIPVPVQVLTHEERLVARLFQKSGNRCVLQTLGYDFSKSAAKIRAVVQIAVVPDLRVVAILTADDGGATWTAEACGHEVVGEFRASFAHEFS